ncbi:MAG: hypothetical protein A3E79_08930 [Burkholderiales bacterium RIFCSPHIGHO2_12_FULL_61_11]|nr:MAG: hypothetical protein A3E79_08930 [Burkholderiales bacterium RIFCSPHIGHO2_12_FULL_61_11]
MTTHTHNCSATACQKQIPLNLLMCMTHWRMVPAPLAREVLDACRSMSRDRRDLERVLAYRNAVEKAVAAVHAKQFRKIADKAATNGALFE